MLEMQQHCVSVWLVQLLCGSFLGSTRVHVSRRVNCAEWTVRPFMYGPFLVVICVHFQTCHVLVSVVRELRYKPVS